MFKKLIAILHSSGKAFQVAAFAIVSLTYLVIAVKHLIAIVTGP